MLTLAIFASGNGSNLQAIIDAIESNQLQASIACVISDRKSAHALDRAKKHNIDAYYVNPREYKSREEHEQAICKILSQHNIGLVVLAGYMRLLTSTFVNRYYGKLINIHPALLPSFPGTHSIENALKYGVKYTGVTIHFVDDGIDTGPIIAQVPVEIKQDDSLESLEHRIHAQEHFLYPKILQWFSEQRIKLDGRKVLIL